MLGPQFLLLQDDAARWDKEQQLTSAPMRASLEEIMMKALYA